MAQTILVTGASGYVGSSVCEQFLEAGFRVRAVARGGRVENLRKSFTSYSDRFEVVEVSDIAKGDFGDALKGVWAVAHVAIYTPGQDEKPEDMITGTIDSCTNIIKQAEAAGVKHVVVTGTVASVMNPQGTFKHDDWNPITKDGALGSNNALDVYSAAKKYSELAIWEWSEAHPNVEVTVLCPPAVYGPWPKEFHIPAPFFASTTIVMWNLLKPDGKFGIFPYYVDVRDLAKAHVRAVTHSVPTSTVGRKRLVFVAPRELDWGTAVDIIKQKRPELSDRVTKRKPYQFPPERYAFDFEKVEEVLGLKREEFHTFEETILDSVDGCLKLEKEWIKNGKEVSIPYVDPMFAAPDSE